MRNITAVAFVVVFLAACGQYVYTNTHPRMTLINQDAYSSEHRSEYLRSGGLIK